MSNYIKYLFQKIGEKRIYIDFLSYILRDQQNLKLQPKKLNNNINSQHIGLYCIQYKFTLIKMQCSNH